MTIWHGDVLVSILAWVGGAVLLTLGAAIIYATVAFCLGLVEVDGDPNG